MCVLGHKTHKKKSHAVWKKIWSLTQVLLFVSTHPLHTPCWRLLRYHSQTVVKVFIRKMAVLIFFQFFLLTTPSPTQGNLLKFVCRRKPSCLIKDLMFCSTKPEQCVGILCHLLVLWSASVWGAGLPYWADPLSNSRLPHQDVDDSRNYRGVLPRWQVTMKLVRIATFFAWNFSTITWVLMFVAKEACFGTSCSTSPHCSAHFALWCSKPR